MSQEKILSVLYLVNGLAFFLAGYTVFTKLHKKSILSFWWFFRWLGLSFLLTGIAEFFASSQFILGQISDSFHLFFIPFGIVFLTLFPIHIFKSYLGKFYYYPFVVSVLIAIVYLILGFYELIPNHGAQLLFYLIPGIPVSIFAGFAFFRLYTHLYEKEEKNVYFLFSGILIILSGVFSIFSGNNGYFSASMKQSESILIAVEFFRTAIYISLWYNITMSLMFFEKVEMEKNDLMTKSILRDLIEKENAMSNLMSNLPGMVYRCENDRDWSMIFVSEGCYELTGYTSGDFIGKRIIYNELIDPFDQDYVWDTVQDALREKTSFTLKYRIKSSGGMKKWVWEQGIGTFDTKGNLLYLEGFISDITEIKKAEKELENNEKKYKQLIDLAQVGIWSIDQYNITTFVNIRIATILGYTQNEMIGRLFSEFVPVDFMEIAIKSIERKKAGIIEQQDFEFQHKSGHRIYTTMESTPIFDKKGNYEGAIAFLLDMTERRETEKKLRYIATHDPLTGLPNRNYFIDILDASIKESKMTGVAFAVLLLDLDRFKIINDTKGHITGDILLKSVSGILTRILRPGYSLARIGGDEFAIVINDVTDPTRVTQFARDIIKRFNEVIQLEEDEFYTTVSIGISLYPKDGENEIMLLQNADTALYQCKDEGRNTFRFFSAEMNRGLFEHVQMEKKLRQAIRNNEFQMYYQPQINLATGKISGVEALIRWIHPIHGLISPDKFIGVAENTGQIIQIGEWVLYTAAKEISDIHKAGFPELVVAVNLSARQFQITGLPTYISDILKHHGVDPQYYEVEITESLAMNNIHTTSRILDEMNSKGIRVSIDDFGTGYSSLAYLKKFPIDKLKIDRSFIRDIPGDREDASIVSAVISMAHSLDVSVVAEGVENTTQISFLKEKECDIVQGYYYSRPIPYTELLKFIASFSEPL